jgi:hypothetical protein
MTWVVLPGGLALAVLALGALWFTRESGQVHTLGGPVGIRSDVEAELRAEAARQAAAEAPPPPEPAEAPSEPEPTPAALAPQPSPEVEPAPARPTLRPAAEPAQLARLGGGPAVEPTRDPRALVRDGSGARTPVPVPAATSRELPAPATVVPRSTGPAGARDLSPHLAQIQRCPTMQACIRAAAPALAEYGHTTPLPDPGVATVERFEETKSAYRRALGEVRAAAKGLVEQPGGAAREASLRAMFEALPQAGAFELEEHEIPKLRRALERSVERWITERRATVSSPLAVQVRLLTPAGGQPFAVVFEHAPSPMAGLSDLKVFLRRELASAPELASFGRQRHATIKLLLSPGGRFSVD